MNSDTIDKVMSPSSSSSSSSRLVQLLDRTRNEIKNGIQNEQSNKDNDVNDGEGDDIVDIDGITNDIQQFTIAERGNELRDCARYNDYVILHTILYVTAVASQDHEAVDTSTTPTTSTIDKDDADHHEGSAIKNPVDLLQDLLHSRDAYTGNTALHMASANNHFNIVQLLLQIEDAILNDNTMKPSCANTLPREEQALRLVQCTNTSGKNTPLHYAVTNRALESIRFLLQDFSNTANSDTVSYTNPYIDVLQQNAAGRSSLTEAFALTSSSSSSSSSTDQNNSNESDPDDDTKRNHEILTLLLEHPSADEERLMQTCSTSDMTKQQVTTTTNENTVEPNQTVELLPPCHTHHFRLVGSSKTDPPNDGIELYIREMAMAPPTMSNAEHDGPAASLVSTKTEPNNNDLIHILGGTVPMNDTTGYGIWSASIIMGQWMTDVFYNNRHHHTSSEETTPIRTILELGAGCGIPGITVAKSFVARPGVVPNTTLPPTVYATDLNPTTLRNLQHNVTTNHVDALTCVVSLDWNELIESSDDDVVWPWMMRPSTNVDLSPENEQNVTSDATNNGIDVLIGSDLVYQKEVVPILLETIHKLRPKKFYYGAAGTNRDGHDLFIQSLQTKMTLVSSCPAPTIYRTTNPLHNQDDDECFIHFQDLLLLSNKNSDNNCCENGNGDDDAFTLYEFATTGHS